MKVYPLLEEISKLASKDADSKDAMLGHVRAHTHHYIGEYDEFTEKMRAAVELLEQSESIAAFLALAKRRGL